MKVKIKTCTVYYTLTVAHVKRSLGLHCVVEEVSGPLITLFIPQLLSLAFNIVIANR